MSGVLFEVEKTVVPYTHGIGRVNWSSMSDVRLSRLKVSVKMFEVVFGRIEERKREESRGQPGDSHTRQRSRPLTVGQCQPFVTQCDTA